MTAQCGGNNVGHIYRNVTSPIAYRQGSTYRTFNRVPISFLSISRYSGTETCAWPR